MLVEQNVIIKWNNANKQWYISKGYVFTKNGNDLEVSVEHLSIGSHSKVKFICDYCSGENQVDEKDKWKVYKQLLASRKNTNKDCCNRCNREKGKETRLKNIKDNNITVADKFPQLIKEWSDKNTTSPYDYTIGSEEKVLWVCSKGHEWESRINSRTLHKSGCPYCSGKIINIDNCLATTHPNLLKEWNYYKNKDIDPYSTSMGSHRKVWWIGKCGHEWESSIYHRVQGRNCPYCCGKKVNDSNSLQNLNPTLSLQWHPTKNKQLKPSDVTLGANKKVWWICDNGHEWMALVSSRSKGKDCPYCTGKKVCEDNCLATVSPEIAKEWNYNRNGNLTPKNVTKSSNKKVWWICNKCKHEWKTTVGHRTIGNGCPSCKESKGEKRIKLYFEDNKIEFITQYEFKHLLGLGGKPLKFDFALFNNQNKLMLLIEYDGEFHYRKYYEDQNFEIQQAHDKRKNDYCKKNSIPILRIPYWDFENIEEILEKELMKNNLLAR